MTCVVKFGGKRVGVIPTCSIVRAKRDIFVDDTKINDGDELSVVDVQSDGKTQNIVSEINGVKHSLSSKDLEMVRTESNFVMFHEMYNINTRKRQIAYRCSRCGKISFNSKRICECSSK